jgi:Ca-activated chloride channel homolog
MMLVSNLWRNVRVTIVAVAGTFLATNQLYAAAARPLVAPVPPPIHWSGPQVRVSDSAARPIELRDLRINTQIIGTQVRTQIDFRLANPNDRVLEGELQFPLLDGQIVTGFALDINGQLRDAVPVPKERGQEIFEDIRRRRVDPALLEVTAGNQYKLRVYPVPARGERRVVLVVTESLSATRDRATWRLPLIFANTMDRLRVDVHVAGVRSDDVRVERGGDDVQRATTANIAANAAHLSVERKQWRAETPANAWLQLSIPITARERTLVGQTNGTRYFAADIPLVDDPVRRTDPKHIALIWDASASAAKQQRIFAVLDAYFKSLRASTRVSLWVVRNKIDPARDFAVSNTDWTALANALRAEPFDGSSNFDELPLPKSVDLTILVSDGLTTDGKREIGYRHSAPLIALNGALAADVSRLTRLAEKNRGRYIDATAGSANDVAIAMWRDGWRIVAMQSFNAKRLVAPTLNVRNAQLQIAGIADELPATVQIQLTHPTRGGREMTVKIENVGRDAQSNAGAWPGQLWGTWQQAALADEPYVNATAIQKISADHGIVGANSSLIVLETAQDYAQYELPAPPELRTEVTTLRARAQAAQRVTQQAHLENVVRQFGERSNWYARTFPKDAPAKKESARQKSTVSGAAVGASAPSGIFREEARAQTAAAPPPPAAAAPVAAARSATADSMRRESVTDNSVIEPGKQQVTTASIQLKAWSSDATYLRRLRDAKDADVYRVYLDLREEHVDSSAFVLDVASHLIERGQTAYGLRVLSNLSEMNLENRQLLRLYGYRLLEAKQYATAIPVFDRVVLLAPNEPQSWRDLGLAYAENKQMQQASDALWETVSRPWHPRFAGVNMIALAELNALIAKAPKDINTSRIDSRLIGNMPLDLRVVMAWDTDDTDIDLWVTDPNGEKSSYSNRLSYQGAAMSPDATGGYGPEEFALRNAKSGNYVIDAEFFGQRQQVLSAGTTVMVRVTTAFGTPQSRDQWLTLRLTKGKETARIGNVEVR